MSTGIAAKVGLEATSRGKNVQAHCKWQLRAGQAIEVEIKYLHRL
jgi:hypothetical protein